MLLSGMIQGILAQNIQIKGSVSDVHRSPLEYANVVLMTNDSTFITGVSTDAKGIFSIEKVKKGNLLLAISSIGYETVYMALSGLNKSTDLHNIILPDASVALEGVTAVASNQTSRIDRKLVVPSERQLKASTNGMDLLQQLMLPRIQVDLMNSQIKTIGNGTVQLRINGVKVEQSDIKALLPQEIVRIEFHDNPGLRYNNADVVLDYIVRRPETGGSFGTNLEQGINAMWAEHTIFGKINYKKSEWSTNYRFGPRNFYGMKRNNEEEFHLADNTSLSRIEIGEPSHAELYMHNLRANYSIQDPDKYMFNVAFRYWANDQPHWDYKGVLENTANPTDQVNMVDRSFENYRVPSLDLYYQKELKNNQLLVFNLVGTYNQSSSHRLYQENRDQQILTDVNNDVKGNKYSIIGEAIYEKKFANNNRISTGLRHSQSFSDNSYVNGHAYNTHMVQGESYLYAEYSGKVKKLDYSVGAGVTRSYYSQRGSGISYERYTANPRLTLFYTFPNQSSIRLKSNISSTAPSLGELSAIDQTIDSLQIQRGNPSLKSYLCYRTELDYEFRKKLVYFNLSNVYDYQPKAIMDEKYQEGNKIIQSWDNQRNWQRWASSAELKVGPWKDLLQISLNGGVNYYISNGNDYTHHYTNWWYNVDASLTWKNFSLGYKIMSNYNWFSGETMNGGENIQGIIMNYRIKAVTIGMNILNPFTDNYKQETENWNRYASYHRSNYFKESSQLVIATFSYNFSFGRKYKDVQKKINNSDSDSGIIKAGK